MSLITVAIERTECFEPFITLVVGISWPYAMSPLFLMNSARNIFAQCCPCVVLLITDGYHDVCHSYWLQLQAALRTADE